MDYSNEAKSLVSQMTLKEKVSLLSGADYWHTKPVERLGLLSVSMADGPHGLRKEVFSGKKGEKTTLPAVCFPTASATACSFDRDLLRRLGTALGEAARAEGVDILLGPGLNCKRSPLCGRNFEYFSEDPVVSGELAAAYVEGVQSQNVGVSVKHFALNNQEIRRMIVDSVADERAMFELYLAGFERVFQKTRPWTVMCSYNRVKGVQASDNHWLLTDVLRTRFGFDGLVMSDWGAVYDRVKGVSAGLDVEMPYIDPYRDYLVEQAVLSGKLDESEVDRCAERVCELALRARARQPLEQKHAEHHVFARNAAAQSAVLLKNEDSLLPLKPGANIAVVGAFAKTPRYQGAGSSKVVPYTIDVPFDEIKALGLDAEYAQGYDLESDEPEEALLAEACRVSAGKDAAVLFLGLPDRYESEGYDREKLNMPKSHIELVKRVKSVNPNVVVVLMGGSVIDMDWEEHAKSILMMYLGGEAVGGAAADLLTGKVVPCGKLAESWPLKLEDNPSSAYFPGFPHTVEYRESIFVGYRYYDTASKPVRYPFGYGLSYSSFAYSNLRLSGKTLNNGETLEVSCDVTNTGRVAASEIVQLYVSHRSDVMMSVSQELKGFEKVALTPGETKTITFTLTRRDLSYFSVAASDWRVEGGAYEVRVSASSRDIRLSASVQAEADAGQFLPDYRSTAPCYYDFSNGITVPDEAFAALLGYPLPQREHKKGDLFTPNSTLREAEHTPLGGLLVLFGRQAAKRMKADEEVGQMIEYLLFESPLRMLTMSGGGFGPKQVDAFVTMLNGKFFRGLWHMRKQRYSK
ncbi:MAG: glycoside hydrolase family 3 C-terminal domain-containing protein [Clostridiaceae bacterium]